MGVYSVDRHTSRPGVAHTGVRNPLSNNAYVNWDALVGLGLEFPGGQVSPSALRNPVDRRPKA
jgi:hypothetical protein